MKPLISFLTVLMLCAPGMRAQDMAQMTVPTGFPQSLQRYLSLTDRQVTEILKANRHQDKIEADKRAEIIDLRMRASQSGQGNPYRKIEDLGAEISQSAGETRSRILDVLSAYQKNKLKELTAESADRKKELLNEAREFRLVEGREERGEGQGPFGGTTPVFNSDTGTRQAEAAEGQSQGNAEKQPKDKKPKKPTPVPPPPPPQ